MSMTTGLCHLQARPVMQRQRSLFHVQQGNSDVTRSWNSATRQYRQVQLMRHKVKGEIICTFALITTAYQKGYKLCGKVPKEFHAAEYGTFNLGDYAIWSRTTSSH